MEYSNPEIPEGINTSTSHPIKEFLLLTTSVLLLVVLVIAILGFTADKLAYLIPFETETKIPIPTISGEITGKDINHYLESLAHKLSQVMEIPGDMSITIHYINKDTVNAFATLGGHVVMYRGLLERLPNENALSMVMAHELAHIKHRHPIRSVGRGVAISLVLSMIDGSISNDLVGGIVNDTGYVTALKFTRDHEHEADASAVQALQLLYGHVNGAEDLFQVLEESSDGIKTLEFFSTHPLSDKRIKRIRDTKNSTADGATTALPENFRSWIQN